MRDPNRNTYLIHGLRRLYAQMLGYIRAGQDRTEDLAHVAHVLSLVAPETDLATITAVRPYKPQRANWSRAALDALRREGRPLSARELAERIVADVGGREDDLTSAICAVHGVMGRLEGSGVIRVQRSPKRWTVERGRD